MASKSKSAPRKKATVAPARAPVPAPARAPARINPAVVVAARNIVNMIVVTASSATVLLTLMIARQIQF
jgi:hypothetical protein